MANIPKFIHFLKTSINFPLPGYYAHLEFSPLIDGLIARDFKPVHDAKRSAVLALFHGDENLKLLFTLRSSNLKTHRGQISFPGGRAENGESPIQTALRETWEETGIEPHDIELIMPLSELYTPPSKSLISPLIGYIPVLPELKLSRDEVDEAFSLDFSTFFDYSIIKTDTWKLDSYNLEVKYWDVHKVPLWGATAMILNEIIYLHRIFEKRKI